MAAPSLDRLVGRDRERDLARAALADLRAGRAATLLIEGEAGIGKTCLIEALVDDARAGGAAVSLGEAHPFEQARPFAAIVDALDLRPRSHDPRRSAIGRLLAGGGTLSGVAPGGARDLRYRVVEEVVDLVETSCAQRPLLLVLEDLHWADTSTLLALRSLMRALADRPLLLAASMRPSPRTPELDQLLADALACGARPIRLAALSTEGVEALARHELGRSPAPELVAVLEKAGGNPLWVVEILRALSADGLLRRDAGTTGVVAYELPDSLRELVVRRLRYLPEATLGLLRTAAVLGDAVSIHDLAVASGQAQSTVAAELDPAFRAGVLGELGDAVAFRHQLVHDAIYQDVPRPVRRMMHRDAASSLAAAGADRLQVADHLMLGAERGDVEAVGWLREGAREAVARGPSVAVRLLRNAEALLPGGHPEADPLAAELVEALLRAGNATEAAARAEAVLGRQHSAEADIPLRLALVSAMSLQNRTHDLVERAESTLAQAPSLPPADQALVLAQASLGRTLSGDLVGGEATARRALRIARAAGDVAMTVWSLTTLSVPLGWQGRYAEALELARSAVRLASEPPHSSAQLRHPRFFLGMALADSDLIADARREYDLALGEYHQLGSVWLLPDTLQFSAAARVISGEWDDALPLLDAGLQAAEELGLGIVVAQSRALWALICVARGDHRTAESALAPVRAELDGDTPCFGAEMVAYSAALLAEADGDLPGALAHLRRFWRHDLTRDSCHYLRYLAPTLVRVALELGEDAIADEAATLAEAGAAAAPEVGTVQSAARRCRALVDDDPDAAMEAVALARGGPRLLDHAGACEDAAGILAAAGRSGEATALLEEALGRYENVGADAWAARVLAALRRLGAHRGTRGPRRRPTHGWESLTDTERSVSLLVAEGLTNRDVARRLHVSPHTVNTHLRHVFDKLSVPNRAGLAATVARMSAPVP